MDSRDFVEGCYERKSYLLFAIRKSAQRFGDIRLRSSITSRLFSNSAYRLIGSTLLEFNFYQLLIILITLVKRIYGCRLDLELLIQDRAIGHVYAATHRAEHSN